MRRDEVEKWLGGEFSLQSSLGQEAGFVKRNDRTFKDFYQLQRKAVFFFTASAPGNGAEENGLMWAARVSSGLHVD